MSYTRFEVGRKRGSQVTFAEKSEDCTCTNGQELAEKLYVADWDSECPVHADAPGE